MNISEYKQWYMEHYGTSPSDSLVQKFLTIQPLNQNTKDESYLKENSNSIKS